MNFEFTFDALMPFSIGAIEVISHRSSICAVALQGLRVVVGGGL